MKQLLIPSLLDEHGQLKSSRTYRAAFMEGREVAEYDELVIEIEAQLASFRAITGKDPDYFEAHAVMSRNRTRNVDMLIDPAMCAWLEAQPNLRLVDYRDL